MEDDGEQGKFKIDRPTLNPNMSSTRMDGSARPSVR